MLGRRRGAARRRRAARRPGDRLGPRAGARELGIDLVAGCIAERVAGDEKLAQHLGPDRPRRRDRARPTARSTCSTSTSAASPTASPSTRSAGDEIVTRAAGGRHRPRADHLLRPALPRALPDPRRRAARASLTVPAAFTAATGRDHWEVAAARAGDREPVLRGRRQPDRRARARHFDSGGHSMIVDPWGVVLAQRARRGERHRRRPRPRRARTTSARRCPSLANRRPERLRAGREEAAA